MDSLSKYGIILIGHGSRRESYNRDLENFGKYISEKLNYEVFLTYNEYSEPNWRSKLKELISEGYSKIIIGLAFLGRGNHIYKDIMGELGITEIGKWVKVNYEGKEVEIFMTEPLANSPLVNLALFLRVLKAFQKSLVSEEYVEYPQDIEENSISIISTFLSDIKDEYIKRILTKVIFASGNPNLKDYVYISNDAIKAAVEALKGGSEILTDVKMVASGIRWDKVSCYIDHEEVKKIAKDLGKTRAAIGIRYGINNGGKIIVIGNSPTALIESIRLIREGKEIPLIIATPPGFTNAKEAKEELIKLKVPSIVVRGTYGGSGIAVAIINELITISREL
jgi:precorrin-8X/cobalt-precorrin-8 methylmutase